MHKHHGHPTCTFDHFQRQFPTPFTDVFPIDLNTDVTLFTVPIETLTRGAVFVTEVAAIHAPIVKVNWACSAFLYATEHDRMSVA